MSRYGEHTDHALLSLLAESDKAAFSEIYHRYFTSMFRYVCSIVKDRKVSEDIVQEIFFELWERHQKLAVHGSLASYLHRAAKYRVLNFIKSEAVRSRYAAAFSRMTAVHSNDTEDRLAVADLQKSIDESIAELPARVQEAFRLSRYEHVPIPEIAERMKISTHTVNDYLTKALSHLRGSLGEVMALVYWLFSEP